jgi:hypothetical protein
MDENADDVMIESVLSFMKEYTWHYELYKEKNNVFSRHVPDERLRSLITTMLLEDLINEITPFSNIYSLTKKGEIVKRAGGWRKHKNDSMTENEKVHRLLEYMWTTNKDRYDWDIKSLTPAFSNLLNEYELKHLCKVLIDNADVRDNRTKDGFSIGFIDEAKSAFHVKKYLRVTTQQPIVSIQTGDIGTVQKNYGTIGESMTQSRDDLSVKMTDNRKQVKQPTENPKRKISKYEKWTLILTGITIVVSIILKLLDFI